MVKTPRTRHSGGQRDPLMIDLDADAVSRVDEPGPADTAEGMQADQDPAAPSGVVGGDRLAGDAAVPEGQETGEGPDVQSGPDVAGVTDESGTKPHAAESSRDAQTYGRPGGAAESAPVFAKTGPRSGLSAIAAGLVGGAVVLVGGGILQYSGLLASGSPVAGAPMLDEVNAEIAALRSEIASIRDAPAAAAADAGRIDGLGQSVEQMQTEIASLRETLGAGSGDTSGLETRLAEIEAALAGIEPGEDAASEADLAAINERLAGLDALTSAAGEAASAIEGRLGAIEQSLAALTAKVEAQTAQPKIALAIAASALRSAIERGAPFQSEIETFAAIVPDAPEVAALRAYAENGVASQAEIAAEADEAAIAIIAAATPVSRDAGFVERLLDSAGSMVSVRPVGAVEGTGVPETVARMEVAINEGDLAAALAEFDSLPEAAKAAGAAFAEKMRARVEAERLTDQAIATAMQAA